MATIVLKNWSFLIRIVLVCGFYFKSQSNFDCNVVSCSIFHPKRINNILTPLFTIMKGNFLSFIINRFDILPQLINYIINK